MTDDGRSEVPLLGSLLSDKEVESQKKTSKEDLEAEEERKLRDSAILVAVKAAEKQFGRGTIMDLGSNRARVMTEVIPSGCLALDRALVIGGYPRGRIVEVYGEASSGKTTLALHAIAEAQKLGGKALFIDAEHALDIHLAEKIGVVVDDLLLCQPDYGEQALEVADMMVRSGGFDIIVVDSVAALVPKVELDGEMGSTHNGLQASLMSQALRKLSSVVSQSRTIVCFINQIRAKIGAQYGKQETTTGGNALKFYASIRLDIHAGEKIREGENVIGHETTVRVVKNKLAPPFRQAEFSVIWGEGISRSLETLDLGVEFGIVTKTGMNYRYKGETFAQGRYKAKNHLRENSKLLEEIRKEVVAAIKKE